MHELLLCVGMFTVLEPRNQDVLLWGKVPTPVHKLCTLFDGLSGQPSVASSLRCTLLAVCIPNQPICEVMRIAWHSMQLANETLCNSIKHPDAWHLCSKHLDPGGAYTSL